MKLLFILIFILLNTPNLFAQLQGQAKIDSLLKELPKKKEDTNAVNLLFQLSKESFSTKPDIGIEYGLQGLELAKDINWNQGVANCYSALGTNYGGGKSNYPKALEYCHKALKIYEKQGYKSGIAANLVNIGLIFSSQSDYPKALEYYHKALKIYEELGNKSGIAKALGNLGSVYWYKTDYTKALEYYHKSLKIMEEIGNKAGIAKNLGNIGNIYIYINLTTPKH